MSRKILLLATLLFSPLTWANGFYVGAGSGPAAANFSQHAHIIIQPPGGDIANNVYDSTQHSGTGAFGTLFGGYQWKRNQYAVSGEVNADVTSMKFESSNQEVINNSYSSTRYRIKHALGISVLPGYIYRDTTLFYGRLGYTAGNFNSSTTDSSLASVNRRLNGFTYGIGVNQTFTQHLGARMEYIHTSYQSTTLYSVTGPATKSTQITPDTGEVAFSLVYHIT